MDIICYSCGRGEKPENTIQGIEHCQEINPDWRIEMDIQISSDEELILFHDYNTKRTTGEDYLINELTLSEIKKLNAGYNFAINNNYNFRSNPIRIPELKEVFTKFPDAKLLLDIHTNNPIAVKILLELIERNFKNGDFIIVSEYDAIIKLLKTHKPNWKFGVAANEAKKMIYSSFLKLDNLFPIKSDILMLPMKYWKLNVLTPRVLKHAKIRNKPIWAWMYEGEDVKTVNTKNDLIFLKKLGIKGIFTDSPEKLQQEIL